MNFEDQERSLEIEVPAYFQNSGQIQTQLTWVRAYQIFNLFLATLI